MTGTSRETSSVPDVPELKEQIAWGCRILYVHGHGDLTLGHVTGRIPGYDLLYMKPRAVGLEEVAPDDVITIDLDGNQVAGHREAHSELPLHTEIYKHRPDVGAVVHTHPLFTTALGSVSLDVMALSHDGILFAEGVPFFDGSPELVHSAEEGAAIARALGNCQAIILRNHGILAVGPTVPWAILTAVLLERVAQMQTIAAIHGNGKAISSETCRSMFTSKYNDRLLGEYWPYLIRKVRRAGLADGMPATDS